MAHLFAANVIVFFLIFCSLGHAQDIIDDIDSRATSTANHNYFAARQSPELQALLRNIEDHHLIWSPNNPGGTMASIRAGRYDYALGDLRYILERFVNHPRALLLLGVVAKLSGTPSLPIPYYERALKLYPRYAMTHAQYGGYLVDIDRSDAGIAKLKKAIEMDADLALAYAWLAKAYAKKGNSALAREAAERAKQLGFSGTLQSEVEEKKSK